MPDKWPNFSPDELFQAMKASRRPWHDNYLAMFSSVWGGFSLDPELWGVPPDDHMVHRGDAVFEVFKVVGGRAYCLPEHLARLGRSLASMGIEPPKAMESFHEILSQAIKLGGAADCQVRLTISRGPGSFAVNPYECQGSQLYLIISRLKRPSPETYERGIRLVTAPFPARSSFASIKTCDYVHNLLAKKAAIDAGGDYVVSFDSAGLMTEGATENAAVVTKGGRLLVPPYDNILQGVTLGRVIELAGRLVEKGLLKEVAQEPIPREGLFESAAEILLTATTFDILGAYEWDGKPVGDGQGPGPVTMELARLIDAEIHSDGPHSAPVG